MRMRAPGLGTNAIARIDEIGEMLAAGYRARSMLWRGLVTLITQLGSGALWFSVYGLVGVLLPQSSAFPVLILVCGEAVGFAILLPLRYGFRRARPDPNYCAFFLTPWNRYSFPSHHSLRAFLVATVLGQGTVVLLPWLLLLAAMIAASRVLLRRHHLSDVLAGAMIGGGIGVFCVQLVP